jgi:hypothetical protein
MTNRFLISVAAAALIAGTGLANAQGMSRDRGDAEHGAATMHRDSGSTGIKGTKSPGMKASESGMKAESHQKMPSGKTAQDSKMDSRMGSKEEKSKSMSSEMKEDATRKDSMKAEGSRAKDNMKAESKSSMDRKSQTTTGNAATSATLAPPAEKRTQIVSVIRSARIQETTNVNFNISVGAVVPTRVHFHPLPARIVEIYPQWRGYEVILVSGRYIIVSPRTHKIVYIIES